MRMKSSRITILSIIVCCSYRQRLIYAMMNWGIHLMEATVYLRFQMNSGISPNNKFIFTTNNISLLVTYHCLIAFIFISRFWWQTVISTCETLRMLASIRLYSPYYEFYACAFGYSFTYLFISPVAGWRIEKCRKSTTVSHCKRTSDVYHADIGTRTSNRFAHTHLEIIQ